MECHPQPPIKRRDVTIGASLITVTIFSSLWPGIGGYLSILDIRMRAIHRCRKDGHLACNNDGGWLRRTFDKSRHAANKNGASRYHGRRH